tara:strand:- start:513 stop:707 length:195 start_codon:yes stop_codon:yes gene_type:complete
MIANLKYNKLTGELTIIDKDGVEMSLFTEIESDLESQVIFKIECEFEDDFHYYSEHEMGVEDGD